MWRKIAELDTEADLPAFEAAENIREEVGGEGKFRTIQVEDGEGCFIETFVDDEDEPGWGRVAYLDADYGEEYYWADEIAAVLDDKDSNYRVVYDYNTDYWQIERYYE